MAERTLRTKRRGERAVPYVGVSWDPKRSMWNAIAYIRGKSTFLGSFELEADAALATDRVTLGEGLSRRLNFPRKHMKPASIEETRAWAKELSRERTARTGRPGRRSTAFRGVRAERGRFRPYVEVDGRSILLGAYDDAREAAIVRDRAVLFFGLGVPLNEPRRARRLGPCSPAELRSEAAFAARKDAASRFVGVAPNPYSEGWDARVSIQRKLHYIARYLTEEDAARARDRAALALSGPQARLNFPNERLRPATIEVLRKEAAAMRPLTRSSALHGVQRVPRALGWSWVATITVRYRNAGYRNVQLGAWPTERQAALAHDRAAIHFPGERRKLNFPAAARKLGPATPKALREEAFRILKETRTSRYRGVSWSSKDQVWRAAIGHRRRKYHLGSFDDEVRAAEAYDEAAERLHGRRAKLNFPS